MGKNLHAKPFDEGTLKKLEIFELYTREWIPTFVMAKSEAIGIFDFFAGTGYDITHVPGSPIRILKEIKSQIGNVFKNKTKLYLTFNEFDKEKYALLKEACDNYVKSNPDLLRAHNMQLLNYKVVNKDFVELFQKEISKIKQYPSLVFLDQNGVKFISDNYFLPLVNSHCTDFLYFVSSSYIKRFGNTEEFKNSISINLKPLENKPATWIHRYILDELRKRIPKGNKTRLYPFSIKKGCNVYGIIFGASHPRAVDKFLSTAWKENTINGEANFDIDDDKNNGQPDLFGYVKLTKIMQFQENLRKKILSKELISNKDVYKYTLEHGHIPAHAVDELKKMKKDGLINFGKSPLINYQQVYQKKNIINYTINADN
jgi:hypothetical protein